MRLAVPFLALLLAWPAVAEAPRLEGDATQGGMMVGRVAPGSHVHLDGKPVRVGPQGRFVIGFGRDFGSAAVLVVRSPGGGEHRRVLEIVPRNYPVQRIDGLPPNTNRH